MCSRVNTIISQQHLVFNKVLAEKLYRNYTRILVDLLKVSLKQQSIKQQIYDHLPPISQAIQVRWTRHQKKKQGRTQ